MDEPLAVDTATLHAVGRDLHGAADDSADAFTRSHAGMSGAADGLFSRSRQALRSKVDQWNPVTEAVMTAVRDHGNNLHTSAALYTSTDGHTSDAIHIAGESPSRPLNLDV